MTKATFTGRFYLSVDFIRLRRHNEIVFMQTFYLVCPPLKIQVASIPKNLVCRLSVNLVVDENTKTRLPLLAG